MTKCGRATAWGAAQVAARAASTQAEEASWDDEGSQDASPTAAAAADSRSAAVEEEAAPSSGSPAETSHQQTRMAEAPTQLPPLSAGKRPSAGARDTPSSAGGQPKD